jgi:hypothetical protein
MRQGMCLPQHMSRRATDDDTCRGIQSLACRAPQFPGQPQGIFSIPGFGWGRNPHSLLPAEPFRPDTNPGARPRQPLAAHDNTPLSDNHVQLPGTALPSFLNTPRAQRARLQLVAACTPRRNLATPPVKRLAFSQGSCDTAACPGTCDFRPGGNKCTLLGRRWHTYSSGQSARIPPRCRRGGLRELN